MLLYHLILSHHGKKEFGSPIQIKTKEAMILHYSDVLSSQLAHIDSLKFNDNWSEKDEFCEYSWYKE